MQHCAIAISELSTHIYTFVFNIVCLFQGGAAGLVLCLFAKLHSILEKKKAIRRNEVSPINFPLECFVCIASPEHTRYTERAV